jgi:hypothetical protein
LTHDRPAPSLWRQRAGARSPSAPRRWPPRCAVQHMGAGAPRRDRADRRAARRSHRLIICSSRE